MWPFDRHRRASFVPFHITEELRMALSNQTFSNFELQRKGREPFFFRPAGARDRVCHPPACPPTPQQRAKRSYHAMFSAARPDLRVALSAPLSRDASSVETLEMRRRVCCRCSAGSRLQPRRESVCRLVSVLCSVLEFGVSSRVSQHCGASPSSRARHPGPPARAPARRAPPPGPGGKKVYVLPMINLPYRRYKIHHAHTHINSCFAARNPIAHTTRDSGLGLGEE